MSRTKESAKRGTLERLLQRETKAVVEAILPAYLEACRWFGGKARHIESTSLIEAIPLPWMLIETFITLVQVAYTEGEPDIYLLPLAAVYREQATQMHTSVPHPILARLQMPSEEEDGARTEVLYEALYDKGFNTALLDAIAQHQRLHGAGGELVAVPTRAFQQIQGAAVLPLEPRVMRVEQSNTSVVYGERFILKLIRHLEPGINPDLEIGRFLTERQSFAHTPPIAGSIEYCPHHGESTTLAILYGFVPNQGDAWQYTQEALSACFEGALARRLEVQAAPIPHRPLLSLIEDPLPPLASELIGAYLASARLLGQRTAELHMALAQDSEDPDFAPEPFSMLYQSFLYQSMRSLTGRVFQLLGERLPHLPTALQEDAQHVLHCEAEILKRFRIMRQRTITAMRIRTHGDYHLGQLLYTGKNFVIIDFEGEPARPLSKRRSKRSPLRDVAGMLRSFHYAAYTALHNRLNDSIASREELAMLEHCAHFWYVWVATVFLKSYLEHTATAPFLPRSPEELAVLLEAYLLEKVVYELGYELNHRPDWIQLPLRGILQLLKPED
jgi:maltose alpha-D-glucosyltransferase/alpha-amylase